MVSNMNVESRIDNIHSDSNRSAFVHSAISQSSVDFQIIQTNMEGGDGPKSALKLDLNQRDGDEKGSFDADEKASPVGVRSPRSPFSNSSRVGVMVGSPSASGGASVGAGNSGGNRSISHQSSITSQVDIVEDRKALRDALYQGIFHRHRRTIFAVGSFLRMLRTRNSQYNTIRSNSEAEDETNTR